MTTLVFALALAIMNPTYSPDSTKIAYTRGNDLFVKDVATQRETRITDDGSDVILNGYSSWVYYEEVLGRATNYRAFWWSPDSRKIAFYRFDNTDVPVFPIFSAAGQDGSLKLTRYPKAGEDNPEVRVGISDLYGHITWADFEEGEQYFGTPFWGPDSKEFFVQRQPRRQNQLGLYSVNAVTGAKRLIYTEKYPTWVTFLDGIVFTDKGLYFARNFETGWEQIYFLSYDGKTFKRLTDGPNWGISILKVDQKKGNVWFTAKRDSRIHPSLYRVDRKGRIMALTDPAYWVKDVSFNDKAGSFTAKISTASMPWKTIVSSSERGYTHWCQVLFDDSIGMDMSDRPHPTHITIRNDGYDLHGLITYPRSFDRSRKYPVLMEVYGGPGNAYVRDRWGDRDASNRWCYENGIIYMVVDPRTSGENGRRGMDESFRRMTVIELDDYIAWARHMQAEPYVDAGRIGVEGFSFGGTTTSMLVLRYPQYFSCGIAGGGVYDWTLYDTIYTERYMDTPSANPDGYDSARVLSFVKKGMNPGKLCLTHGTADDNVHFQNTLQMVDALQKAGIQFELMIYPEGMHGYRGLQHEHDMEYAHEFWRKNLLCQ